MRPNGYFLSTVEKRLKGDVVLTAEDARESIAVVLAERKSAETGKTVKIGK